MLNDIVHNQELSDQGRQGRALKKALGSVSNIGEMLYWLESKTRAKGLGMPKWVLKLL